ncbi:MAG: RNase adapter RapZ [Actinomycetaceae bacterium]|nr:RNase adapter RapZ [Actinomycetaceae bacterium]
MSNQQNPSTFPHGIPALDQAAKPKTTERPRVLIITGLSGAGRSRAAQALEDLDWYVVDNLPPRLLGAFAKMMTPEGGGVHRMAAVVDVRSGRFFEEFNQNLDNLGNEGIDYQIIYLEADDATLVRRYEQVRRPHPLQGDARILDGVREERKLLRGLRDRADAVIDTSKMSVHDLARHMRDVIAGESDQRLKVTVMSFGFKHGAPLDADHQVDVRFLANPYWVTELRHLTGLDKPVSDYVLAQRGATEFAEGYVKLLSPVLNDYLSELKPFVTIAVGCTGGRHRSVAMTEKIAAGLREAGFPVRTLHRDMGRD